MKKIVYFWLGVLLLTVILATVGVAPRASLATALGYIDVPRVFDEFKETANAKEALTQEEQGYKKELESRQKKLDEAEKGKKPKEVLEKLRTELQDELNPKLQKLQKMRAELSGRLQQKIVDAVKEVGKQVGIDVVIDKQAVISGGVDLTDLVVNKLNAKK